MGYRIALWCDSQRDAESKLQDWWTGNPSTWGVRGDGYPGYAKAVNHLVACVLEIDPACQFTVVGGDDTYPDPNKRADEIARECEDYFWLLHKKVRDKSDQGTFGVMQPTGDRYANGQIDRICGSAWIGREFALRVNQGRGPLWPEYTHMFVDQELQGVALKYGVLWQRPDLIQLHMQAGRESSAIDAQRANTGVIPAHITHDGYTPEHWQEYEKMFNERKAAGFPGSELK